MNEDDETVFPPDGGEPTGFNQTANCAGCGGRIPARWLVCDQCWRALPAEARELRGKALTLDAQAYACRAIVLKAGERKGGAV